MDPQFVPKQQELPLTPVVPQATRFVQIQEEEEEQQQQQQMSC
jgi:hypothetical protein